MLKIILFVVIFFAVILLIFLIGKCMLKRIISIIKKYKNMDYDT